MFKFAVTNFAGKPHSYWVGSNLVVSASTEAPGPSHQILVIDCSGSMYYVMAETRNIIKKMLSVAEYNNPQHLISVISYSSKGTARVHFSRVPVTDVMSTNSKFQVEIDKLQANGLTCISDGLALAEPLIKDEATAISLHSDGYANHLSPASERQALMAISERLGGNANVFINTIAYSDYSDFGMLCDIANKGSGTCVRARTVKDVYDALVGTAELLTKSRVPSMEFVSSKEGTHLLYLSREQGKVLGATDHLLVRGISASDGMAWELTQVTESEYATCGIPNLIHTNEACAPMLALARSFLASGDLTTAKYIAYSTGLTSLRPHLRALTGEQIADFIETVDTMMFQGGKFASTYDPSPLASGPSIVEVLENMSEGVLINVNDLKDGYSKRSVSRVAGTRNEDGSITPPKATLKSLTKSPWLQPSFVYSNEAATINMRFSVPSQLVDTEGNVIEEVAGVVLDGLKTFRMYTIIGDGSVCVPSMKYRVTSKSAHQKLEKLIDLGKFDPNQERTLDLASMSVVGFDGSACVTRKTVDALYELHVYKSILSALNTTSVTGGEGSYTNEQITALAEVHITPALYYSAPTTTPYTDLDNALNAGTVDYITTYSVSMCTPEISGTSDFFSANTYLQRRWTLKANVTENGKTTLTDIAKPTLAYFYDPSAQWELKKLSARTKLDAVDDIMFPIMNSLINGGFKYSVAPDEVADSLAKVESDIEAVWSTLRPLVCYVGATGLIPDSVPSTMLTSDGFAAKYNTKVSKAQADATFFLTNDEVAIVVSAKNKLVSRSAA